MIPLKPLSVNQMHGVFRGRKIKSKAGREFEIACNHHLASYFDQAKVFIELFDENTQALRVEYKFYFPDDDMITKRGTINKRHIDADNCIKIFNDNLFKFLGLDDGLVIEIRAVKIPSIDHWTEIVVQAINIPAHVPEIKVPDFSDANH